MDARPQRGSSTCDWWLVWYRLTPTPLQVLQYWKREFISHRLRETSKWKSRKFRHMAGIIGSLSCFSIHSQTLTVKHFIVYRLKHRNYLVYCCQLQYFSRQAWDFLTVSVCRHISIQRDLLWGCTKLDFCQFPTCQYFLAQSGPLPMPDTNICTNFSPPVCRRHKVSLHHSRACNVRVLSTHHLDRNVSF